VTRLASPGFYPVQRRVRSETGGVVSQEDHMPIRGGRSFVGAQVPALLMMLGLCLAPPVARAWEYPLLPHVHGLAFFPETPNTEYRTSVLLSAVYPNECWRLVDTLRVDSTHVRVTLAPGSDCDSLSYWTHHFDLGYFVAGLHHLTVHCTVLQDGQPPLEEEITVPFEVVEGPLPPPPPPPGLPLLQTVEVIPSRPVPGEEVSLRLEGFTPFPCTWLHDDRVVDPANVTATFEHRETCEDTTGRWLRVFALGSYPEGDHRVDIHLVVNGPDGSHVEEHAALVRVRDATEPPPPPGDSLTAGLSPGRPNPFRDAMEFSVSLDEATTAEVAVFDPLGRRVATIHRGPLPRGTSRLAWNGRRDDGSRAPGGIYFCQLALPGRKVNRRVVLLGSP
jgi:hypothetical protein